MTGWDERLALDGHRQVYSSTTYVANKRSMLRGGRKIIRDVATDSWLYYDLSADPREQSPLKPTKGLQRLKSQMVEEMSKPFRTVEKRELGDEQVELLEQLGYLDVAEDPEDEPADPEKKASTPP